MAMSLWKWDKDAYAIVKVFPVWANDLEKNDTRGFTPLQL